MKSMLSKSISLYRLLQKQYSRRINLDLNRIQKVLEKLDNPHLNLKNPINILGSDGKMSVLTSLKYFLKADRKKITAFTSPHLYDPRHRIFLKNNYISLKQIKSFKKKVEKTKLELTLFELLTCIYILASNEQKKVDFNLIESGLLFRKDSTNLWKAPKAQIVTNINFQHQEWINPKTIYEICKQKIGFLSKDSVIYIAPQEKKTLKIIKKILKKNPSKKVYSSTWKILKKQKRLFYKERKIVIPIQSKFIHSKALISNLGLAIKVALDLGVKKTTIISTIPKINFEGRLQYLKSGKLINTLSKKEKILFDGCHSLASAKNLNDYLKTIKDPIYGIWGMQKNKMPEKFIKVFNDTFKKIITLTIPDEPNALNADDLFKIGKNFKFNINKAKNINDAIKKITSEEKKTIVVFGSLYLVGYFLKNN